MKGIFYFEGGVTIGKDAKESTSKENLVRGGSFGEKGK